MMVRHSQHFALTPCLMGIAAAEDECWTAGMQHSLRRVQAIVTEVL